MAINETQADRASESDALARLAAKWKCEIAHTDTKATVDGVITSNGTLRAFVEYREARHKGQNVIISQSKVIKINALAEMLHVPAFFLYKRDGEFFLFDMSIKPDSQIHFDRETERQGDYTEWVNRYLFSNPNIKKINI